MEVGQLGRRAAPDGAGQVRAEVGQSRHPHGGQFAQCAQLGRLRVGMEDRDVLAHGILHLVVPRQRGAWSTEVAGGALLGGPPVHAFVDDEPCGGGGDFSGEVAHGICALFMRPTMRPARPMT